MTKENNHHLPSLIIGALGVVYGDIGTSPLYALKKCFSGYDIPINADNILGIISLIIWALGFVVSVKYICLILRADNDGEGGIVALTTLCIRSRTKHLQKFILALGILGTAMFYGDGVITPAISVLSALEGVTLIFPQLESHIPYMACLLLIGLFMVQKYGSTKIGQFFGPIMLLWFALLAILGLVAIMNSPEILAAINPYYGAMFLINYNYVGVLTLGAIVLVVTGAEALYADLGHFTKTSIRLSWFILVFPALILNYLGQGALLLQDPSNINYIFYKFVPNVALYPMVFIATLATVIASQSIISGIFSMSWQAIQLGYLPRMKVLHTSTSHMGQVYLPLINYLMLGMTLIAVLLFRNSENIASAYGITVTGIMLITTILATMLSYYQWKWSKLKIMAIFLPLLCMDLIFLVPNLHKLVDGGWFPILITTIVYLIITTWRRGREILAFETVNSKTTLAEFVQKQLPLSDQRIPGTAIFMSRFPERVPAALTIHLEHNKYLHERVIFLSIITLDVPRVPIKDRVKLITLADNIYQVIAYYGFIGIPDIQAVFDKVHDLGVKVNLAKSSFFISRDVPIASSSSYLSKGRKKLFIFLSQNTISITEFFKIPYRRVVELGNRFKL